MTNTYFEAWNNRDLKTLSDIFAENITLRDWEQTYNGKENVLKANQNIFDAHKNIELTLINQATKYDVEQEKYIQYRFTKRFVIKITHLEGAELERFMNFCRPSYEVLGLLNDLELGYYIEKKLEEFKI